MKRSQAIDCIEYYLKTTNPEFDKRFLAECILIHLEEDIGMNPPYDSTSDDEDPHYNWQPE